MLKNSFIPTILSKRCFAIRSAGTKPNKRSSFEKNMPEIGRKKAWEKAGEDKDVWFKRNYAHVHAREKQMEPKDPYGKKKAHFDKLAEIQINNKIGLKEHRGRFDKRSARHGLQVNPLMEYVYGNNGILAALQGNKREYFTRLLYHGTLSPEIQKLAKEKDIKIEETDKHRLNLITNYAVHNNVALETKPLQPLEISHLQLCDPEAGKFQFSEMVFENEFKSQESTYIKSAEKNFPLGIYLDEVVDPHNIGAIIRSAYFLGADFMVMSRKNCAPLSPAVSKTSSGAVELMPIYYVDKPLNFFAKSQEEGGWTFITSCLTDLSFKDKKYSAGKNLSLNDLGGMCNQVPIVLVVGNEGNGVRTNLKMRSDFFVEIPYGRPIEADSLKSPVDSLNVSVATALLVSSLVNNT